MSNRDIRERIQALRIRVENNTADVYEREELSVLLCHLDDLERCPNHDE